MMPPRLLCLQPSTHRCPSDASVPNSCIVASGTEDRRNGGYEITDATSWVLKLNEKPTAPRDCAKRNVTQRYALVLCMHETLSSRMLDALDVPGETGDRSSRSKANDTTCVVDVEQSLQQLRGILSAVLVGTSHCGVPKIAFYRHDAGDLVVGDSYDNSEMVAACAHAGGRVLLRMDRTLRIRAQQAGDVFTPVVQPHRGLRHVSRHSRWPNSILKPRP